MGTGSIAAGESASADRKEPRAPSPAVMILAIVAAIIFVIFYARAGEKGIKKITADPPKKFERKYGRSQ